MTSIRVAYDIGPLSGARSGVGRFTEELLSALRSRSDVTVDPWVLSARAALGNGVQRLPLPALVAQRLWERSDWPSLDRSFGQAHIVHGTNFVVPPPRRPTVITVHDASPFTMTSSVDDVVRRFPAIVRRAVRRGAWVHAVSEHSASELRSILGTERVVSVHSGPTFGSTPPGELPHGVRSPFVLAVGTVEHRKNHITLVEAFAKVRSIVPDLQLVIAGSPGSASPVVETAIVTHRLTGSVVLSGFVTDAERAALYSQCSVVAYPSLDEGFGFPLLEAMQARVPIVASTAGALPEVAVDAALLVAPTDSDALAEAIISACTDTELRSDLIARGTDRLGHFSWARSAAGMVELYQRAIAAW